MSCTTAKRALFCASMLSGMLAATSALAAPALPTGGHVAAGSAAIGQAGATLTVSQSSAKAIVDWSSFGVGQGGTVQFDNGSGATLNRVTGTGVSSIDGLLSATGSVYLINPNGVIVGKSGVVNTGGSFVASTLDVANSSFLAGGPPTFSGPSTASVINLGKVGSLGGNVGLIAATVRNDGTISAPRGDVGLAAGTTVTLDDAANDAGGLFSVKVGGASTSATNTGAISAAAVELRAQQGNVYALAGNAGGVINATGIDATGGVIKLISTGGTTEIAGTLNAQGANGAAGQIETSGATLDIGVANVDTHGGSWLLDPTSLIVNAPAASTIDGALATGNVTLATSASGTTGPGSPGDNNGDILIEAPLTWSSGSTLAINSFDTIAIDAPVTVGGAGSVAMTYGPTGRLEFGLGPSGFAGSLSYAIGTGEGVAGQALSINGTAYTLLYSMADVAALNGGAGQDALATSLASTAAYTGAVVGSFSGTLEGLGNTIAGLTINGGSNDDVGLIGTLNSAGLVRNLGLVGGTVSGTSAVGSLAGVNRGTVVASYATVTVSGASYVGGLIGQSGGAVETSYAAGAVEGSGDFVGGLVGYNSGGTVEATYATGAVSNGNAPVQGQYFGGLIGYNAGTVETSYASGAVSDDATSAVGKFFGGLVGYNTGVVETSHATGAVTPTQAVDVGGLVGFNIGTVKTSYATGATFGVEGVGGLVGENENGTVDTSYATGAISAGDAVGGLVGYNYGGTIETSYATGASRGQSDGGLIGASEKSKTSSALIETSFATGAVEGFGLVGDNGGGSAISNSYWDVDTTGSGTAVGGSGSTGGTGLTTAQLQSNYNNFMAKLNSGGSFFAGGTGGLYPYLVGFFPDGVQAIVSTTAPFGNSVAPQVALYQGGVLLGGGAVSPGENGYIYLAVAAGTLGASNDKIGADLTLAGGSSPSGLVYTDAGSVASGILTLPALAADQNAQTTRELTLSALNADLSATFGASTFAGLQTALAGAVRSINATSSSFAVNQTVSTAGLAIETSPGAPLTVANPITLTGAGALTLDAGGALAIDAPIAVTGGGQVALDYGVQGLSFDAGLTSFAGSLSFAAGTGEGIAGQALSLNATSYTLLYSMTDVAAMGASGAYALAGPVTSATPFSNAVVGSFSGTLEGLGNSISGLTINGGANSDVGLIGTLGSGGVVRDLGLVGGSVSGLDNVGALVGLSSGTVTATRASVNVSDTGAGFGVGGLVGDAEAGSAISGSAASGKVTGMDSDRYIGGLVGDNDGAMTSDMAFGRVMSPASLYVGGLVGFNAVAGTIDSAFASGAVSAPGSFSAAVGGLVGYNSGTIADTYAYSGAVSGASDVGGLVGVNLASVSTSWSSGGVSGTTDIGGSIGLQSAGALASLYWDEGLSGTTTGVGGGASSGVTGIGGTTGLSPTAQATYGGFNFTTTWNIIPGSSRPFLRSLFP